MNYITAFCSGISVIMYAIIWYAGVKIDAWQAMLWVSIVFIDDIQKLRGNK